MKRVPLEGSPASQTSTESSAEVCVSPKRAKVETQIEGPLTEQELRKERVRKQRMERTELMKQKTKLEANCTYLRSRIKTVSEFRAQVGEQLAASSMVYPYEDWRVTNEVLNNLHWSHHYKQALANDMWKAEVISSLDAEVERLEELAKAVDIDDKLVKEFDAIRERHGMDGSDGCESLSLMESCAILCKLGERDCPVKVIQQGIISKERATVEGGDPELQLFFDL
uniref:BZIP domain-containing protein n=1 Tax=Steinernema glaseri TaxID=37863 RepID=A0A1I8AGU4_9BILA